MRFVRAAIVVAFLLARYACAGIIPVSQAFDLQTDFSIDLSAPIQPGSTDVVIAPLLVFAPESENVRDTSLIVNLFFTGTVGISNLSLWDAATQLGQTIATPGPTNTFSFDLVVPALGVTPLQLLASVLSGTSGTIQVVIPTGGLIGVGLTSLEAYGAPASSDLAVSDPLQVGDNAGGETPEPAPVILVAGGLLVLLSRRFRLKRK